MARGKRGIGARGNRNRKKTTTTSSSSSGSKGKSTSSKGKSTSSKSKSTSSSKSTSKSKSTSSNKKTYSRPATTVAQKRFRAREAAGLSGLTGGPKNADGSNESISQYRARQRESVVNNALGRQATFQTGIPSGDNLKAGSFGISEAGRLQAERNRAEAAAKAEAEATRARRFDPNRLSSTFTGNNNLGINSAKGFNALSVANMVAPGRNLGSWYNQGRDTTKSFKQLMGDEYSMRQRTQGLGKGSWNPFRGMPGYGTVKNFVTGKPFGTPHKGGFESGPTESNRRVFNNLTKAAAAKALFNQGQTGSITDQIANQTIGKFNPYAGTAGQDQFSTEAAAARERGGLLSIGGFKMPEFGISEYMGINTADRAPENVQVASTDAGGLNIGGGVDSEGGSSTGRTVVSTDRDKNINYDIGGIAGEAAMRYNRLPASALDAITGNRFDFDNLGRPGDDKTIAQKVESLKKSPIKKAVLSAQTGVDANRIINEGGAAAENLMKNYVSQIDASSAKGIRNPIARLFRDTAGENQTDATAMAGRAMSAFSVDDENFSDKPNTLTKLLKFTGLPQLSEENVQDIRHTMNTNVTEDTGIPGKGLTNIPYSQAFGLANRITSGKIKDGVEESMNQLGMNNVPTLDDAVALGSQFKTNMDTKGTTTAKRMGELDALYKKYGPGGGQAPTLPSIIKGIGGAVGRSGGSGSPMQIQGASGMTATLPTAIPQQQQLPLPLITQQTGVGAGNLQNIQQNAYNNQMSMYGTNPNYFAQFRPQQRFPRRGSFRSAFSRDYFN